MRKVLVAVLLASGWIGATLHELGRMRERPLLFPEQTYFYESYYSVLEPVYLIPIPGLEGYFEAIDIVFSKCRLGTKSGLVVKMLDSDTELVIEAGEPIVVTSSLLSDHQVLVLGILDEVSSCRGEAVVRWFEKPVLVDVKEIDEGY